MYLFAYLFLVFVAIIICYIRNLYNYWERNGFPYDTESTMPFGCLKSVAALQKSMGMAIYDVYWKTKERFIGVYLLYRPALLVRDVELVRNILTKDFSSFHDRGVYVDLEKDPLNANLFSLRGQDWRTMRVKLAPSFTSGKLKGMYGVSEDIGNKMVDYLNATVPKSGTQEVDLKEVLTTYAVDIIASTIFGLEINSYENPKNKFRVLVHEIRRNTVLNAIFGMLIFLVPSFAKFLLKFGFKNKAAVGLLEIMRDTVEYREKHNIIRKDLLQLLIQLRNTGKINEDDENWTTQTTAENLKSMSMELIAAQAFIFYVAGQETTASTAALTIWELAQYPKLLKCLQEEVEETLSQNGGTISYETLQKMEFLDLCISETVRKYPGLPMLNRECTEDYQIPGTDKIIKKGTPIVISLLGIHRDPENFPDPEKYDPERFIESNRNYNPNAYMPFGEGPRICIAQRMGKVNAKLAVVKILQHFNIEVMEKKEMEFHNFGIALMPKYGVKVKLSKKIR